MTQQQSIEQLIKLSEEYLASFKVLKDCAQDLEKEHGFAPSLAKLFEHSLPASEGSFVESRPDLAPTFWADVHHVMRGIGKPLMKDLREHASKQPDNPSLALVVRVAEDMSKIFDSVYTAAKRTENVFKTRIRKEDPSQAQIRWYKEAVTELRSNPEMKPAEEALLDALVGELGYKPTELRKANRRGVFIADYEEEFPWADKDQLFDAVVLGETLAAYNFISNRGFKVLSYVPLRRLLNGSARFDVDAVRDVADLCDALNRHPYNLSLGLKETELAKHLTGHSRQLKIYALFEEIVTGNASIAKALPHLKALGMDEEVEIKTGKEMAVLIYAIAHQQKNRDGINIAQELFEAKTREGLQAVLQSKKNTKVLDAIATVDGLAQPALKQAQELLQDARERLGSLDVKLPSAARQFVVQREQNSASLMR